MSCRFPQPAIAGSYPWGAACSPCGDGLYYLGLDGTLMAVAIEASTSFIVGKAARLFQSPLRALAGDTEQYAVAPDGSRFLFAPFIETAKPDGVRVVTNWMSLLPQPRD